MNTKDTKDTKGKRPGAREGLRHDRGISRAPFYFFCVSFVFFVSFVLIARAQQTFHTTRVIVEVDAVVADAKGRFAADLTADDFEVREEGVLQHIEQIYLVNGNAVTAVTAGPSPAAAPESALPPAAPPRVFVLMFDQDHLQPGAFNRLRDAAIAFLTSEFRPGDVGGVVVGSAMAGNQLTSDREALLAAVRHAKPSAAETSRRLELYEWPRLASETEAIRIALFNDRDALDQAVRRACGDDPLVCRNASPDMELLEKARSVVNDLRPAAKRTVMTLQALASGLSRLPGRKTIVLMTEGFFVEESWADLRQIVGAAARSNVRIYSLDARGLDTRQINDLRQQTVIEPGGMPLEAYNTIDDGPNALAVDTGGYAIRRTNNFADALTEIARDTSRYYVLGYSPADSVTSGAFRAISVRVRRPGLTVRARRGYVASTPAVIASAPAPAPPASASSDSASDAVSESARESLSPPTTGFERHTDATTEVPGVRLRPDSNARVQELAAREGVAVAASDLASRGWEQYQNGDVEGAANLLGKAAIDPNARPWVHYALGFSELALRHFDKAARAWERVRAAVPEFRTVYLDLADAYMQQESYGRAIDVLRAADARWPADADVLNAMGTIQVRRGALDDAIGTFRRATGAHPDEALAYFNLGRSYELRYFKRRRFSQSDGRWMANSADVKNAIAAYEEYVKLGGPFETQARNAIQNLQWLR